MPTTNQIGLYMSFRCASEFKQVEVNKWDLLMLGTNDKGEADPIPPSMEQVTDLLNHMRDRLKAYDQRKADALTRKAQYRTWADQQKG